MGQARATVQYWAVTPSNSPQANGPIQRLWVDTTAGTLVLTSGDGSTFTLNAPKSQWIEFENPITIVGAASTAAGIIASGWGAPSQSS